MTKCSVPDCDKQAVAKGWCRNHWKRNRRNGHPTRPALPRPRIAVEDRFWSKVDKDGPVPEHRPELGPCWVWTRSVDGWGYGYIRDGNIMKRAHRVSWTLANGEIPDGMRVLHHCDNPPCVNSQGHLFLGTDQDNIDDRVAKDRDSRKGSGRHGEHSNLSKLTRTQVDEIRRRYLAGGIYQKDLAAEYGVAQTAVSRIVRGVHWNTDGATPRMSFEDRRGGRR